MLGGQVLAQDALAVDSPKWSIAIHGGAGTITRERMTPELEAQYEAALQNALDAGAKILADGGSALDAIQAAIVLMEDDPKFNAGRGAVYTWDGANELDASIMDGRDRSAGAVTGVTSIKNPILLADKVRTESVHVFLSGKGAEEFAATQDIETAEPEWFETESRKRALERVKAEQLSALDVDHKFGTVGAVALDQDGNLAAGTSTGGMTAKRWGRIGDAPVIGAGTYADNRSCAVSATGWGEYFIRVGVAQEICTLIRVHSSREPVICDEDQIPSGTERAYPCRLPGNIEPEIAQAAADYAMDEVQALGGDGGIILVTPEGHALYSFNTAGMYRGRATSEGVNEVAIFGEVLAGEE
ncbi:isoaspartyl peptidase/L-asparaginase family protein [Qipengyuania sp. DGS5-3]|uniref:isoaspartyl peptidase/L-asparaginase family protein n=1 Tax=Qipengyuania sp. DGS5-3 TaxID=3349632 RepID=UPI0036D414AB